MKPPAEPPLLITRREAARLLGITERALTNFEKQGMFTPIKLGRCVRYRRGDIEARLAEMVEAAMATRAARATSTRHPGAGN